MEQISTQATFCSLNFKHAPLFEKENENGHPHIINFTTNIYHTTSTIRQLSHD